MKKRLSFFTLIILMYGSGYSQYRYISKNELIEDMDSLWVQITSIHPRFQDKTFLADWAVKYSLTKAQIQDSMTQNQYYTLVAPILAILNDGHSNFLCPSEQRILFMKSGGLSFPFGIEIIDSLLSVKEYFGNDSTLFSENEFIATINSIPVSDILLKMRQLTGAESDKIRNKTIEYYFRTLLWILYGFEADYQLELINKSGGRRRITLGGITNEQFLQNRKRYSAKTENLYSLALDDEKSLAILKIKSFADLNSFCSFADSSFKLMKQQNIKNLVIDIRGNSGGRSVVVDSLMNYLTNKKYRQYKRIETMVSYYLKAYYKEDYPDKYEKIKKIPAGKLISNPGEKIYPKHTINKFNGGLTLLIDGTTYSAASTFAGIFKELKLGTIIGQKTGGTIEYYGDFFYLTLPNSSLKFHISPKRYIQYGSNNLSDGISPNIKMEFMDNPFQAVYEQIIR